MRHASAMRKSAPAASPSARGAERRNSPRQPYPVVVRIALCPGGRIPEPLLFRAVMCHDISFDGISFFSDETLPCEAVVIELGTEPRTIRMLAHVVHQIPATMLDLFNDQAKSSDKFVIGCEFFQRLAAQTSLPAEGAHLIARTASSGLGVR